jgi:hypothetical protein
MRALVLAIVAALLAGCATTTFRSQVSGFADGTRDYRSFILLPDGREDDFEYREYATYVQHILEQRGLSLAPTPAAADIAIFVGYGIGDPERTAGTYTLPTFGQTGVSQAATQGTVTVYGNTATVNATTNYTPTYGVTGYQTHVYTETVYTRFVRLKAFYLSDFRDRQELVPAFETTVVSAGSSGDLREVMPAMLLAAAPHIGRNTGRAILVDVRDDSPDLQTLRQQLFATPE